MGSVTSNPTMGRGRTRHRRWFLLLIVLVGLAGLAAVLWFPLGPHFFGGLSISACFENARDLRSGAQVRIAGVGVGHVKSVRAQPDRHDCPAEVHMILSPGYDLRIPGDSIVRIETAGILGNPFVEIDAKNGSGPPLANHGVLKSQVSEEPSIAKVVELLERLQEKPCREKQGKAAENPKK